MGEVTWRKKVWKGWDLDGTLSIIGIAWIPMNS